MSRHALTHEAKLGAHTLACQAGRAPQDPLYTRCAHGGDMMHVTAPAAMATSEAEDRARRAKMGGLLGPAMKA